MNSGVTKAGVDVQKMEQASNSVSLIDGLIWVPNNCVSVSAALLTHLIYAPFVWTTVDFLAQKTSRLCAPLQPTGKRRGELVNAWGWKPHTSKVSSFFERWGKLGWMATTCQGVVKSFLSMFCHFGAGYFEVKYPRRCRDVFRMFEGFSIEFSKKMIGQYN